MVEYKAYIPPPPLEEGKKSPFLMKGESSNEDGEESDEESEGSSSGDGTDDDENSLTDEGNCEKPFILT